jgi:hypothetical protein
LYKYKTTKKIATTSTNGIDMTKSISLVTTNIDGMHCRGKETDWTHKTDEPFR